MTFYFNSNSLFHTSNIPSNNLFVCNIVITYIYHKINHKKMSTTLLGTTFALEVDTVTATATNTRGTDANYKLLACLTSNGVEYTVAEQDTSNKCDGGNATSIPGLSNWTMSGDGQAVTLETGEAATKTNYQAILALAVAKTVFFARFTDPSNTVVREGKVFITSYSETAPNADAYTFTVSFKGVGPLFITPVAP